MWVQRLKYILNVYKREISTKNTGIGIFAAACANIHFHAFWFWLSKEVKEHIRLPPLFLMVKTLILSCLNDLWYQNVNWRNIKAVFVFIRKLNSVKIRPRSCTISYIHIHNQNIFLANPPWIQINENAYRRENLWSQAYIWISTYYSLFAIFQYSCCCCANCSPMQSVEFFIMWKKRVLSLGALRLDPFSK